MSVVLYDAAHNVMRPHVFESRIPVVTALLSEAPIDAAPGGVVWQTQRALLISPTSEDTRFPLIAGLLRAHDINTLYVVPLAELKSPAADGASSAYDATTPRLLSMTEMERAHIEEVLRRTRGTIAGRGGAAEILGLPASTLRARMKKLGLK